MAKSKKVKLTIEIVEDKERNTDVIVLLDRSGSMTSIADDTIGSFNSFLSEQQNMPEDGSKFTLVQFDDQFEVVTSRVSIKEASKLTDKTFRPRGCTALLDAMGKTIELAEGFGSKKVIVVVITDGCENASRVYSRSQIFDKISKMKNRGWEFIFLAANQDAIAEGAKYGFDSDKTVNFNFNTDGIRAAHNVMACSVSQYRTMGAVDGLSVNAEDHKLENTVTSK